MRCQNRELQDVSGKNAYRLLLNNLRFHAGTVQGNVYARLVRNLGAALHHSSTAFDVTGFEATVLNESWKGRSAETDTLLHHTLRTLLKQGNSVALSFTGIRKMTLPDVHNFVL